MDLILLTLPILTMAFILPFPLALTVTMTSRKLGTEPLRNGLWAATLFWIRMAFWWAICFLALGSMPYLALLAWLGGGFFWLRDYYGLPTQAAIFVAFFGLLVAPGVAFLTWRVLARILVQVMAH